MGPLDQFFWKVYCSWDVENCLGYFFSVMKIFLPHPCENISSGDQAATKLLSWGVIKDTNLPVSPRLLEDYEVVPVGSKSEAGKTSQLLTQKQGC